MTIPAPLAFVDCETTGLDPDRHEVWEVAVILRLEDDTESEHVWQLPVDLGRADPMALAIGRYHERDSFDVLTDPASFATKFARLTAGAHLVGACVSFDADRLWRLLRSQGECPMWHYHLVDVEALAAGWLAGARAAGGTQDVDPRPPWSSSELSNLVGVIPEVFDRHTALGDAKWARAIYDAVMA